MNHGRDFKGAMCSILQVKTVFTVKYISNLGYVGSQIVTNFDLFIKDSDSICLLKKRHFCFFMNRLVAEYSEATGWGGADQICC